jgi:predicted nucleic acid-binding protein
LRVALDSNILAYVEGVDDPVRLDRAHALVQGLPPEEVLLPVQALGELYSVLRRKGGKSGALAREIVESWRASYDVLPTSQTVFASAILLAETHAFQIWDAIILAAAAEAGCAVLLSENMQDGFVWGGVTVVNPFATQPHPLLARLLRRRH